MDNDKRQFADMDCIAFADLPNGAQFWASSSPPRYVKINGNCAVNVQTGKSCLMTGMHGVYPIDIPNRRYHIRLGSDDGLLVFATNDAAQAASMAKGLSAAAGRIVVWDCQAACIVGRCQDGQPVSSDNPIDRTGIVRD